MLMGAQVEGRKGPALPPMATLRYLQWLYLSHSVYGCCVLISVCAGFQVVFFGMKFDHRHCTAWLIGCAGAFLADIFVVSPLVCILRQVPHPLPSFHP